MVVGVLLPPSPQPQPQPQPQPEPEPEVTGPEEPGGAGETGGGQTGGSETGGSETGGGATDPYGPGSGGGTGGGYVPSGGGSGQVAGAAPEPETALQEVLARARAQAAIDDARAAALLESISAPQGGSAYLGTLVGGKDGTPGLAAGVYYAEGLRAAAVQPGAEDKATSVTY